MKKSILTILVCCGSLANSAAMAADGTITITGQVMDSSCVIAIDGGTGDISVALPSVSKTALATDGATAGLKQMAFTLTGCPASGAVRAYFSPQNVDSNTGFLMNNAVASPATNVQVQVLAHTGDVIDLRDNSNNPFINFVDVDGTSGEAQLQYGLRYTASGGAAVAGSVDTALVYTLDYQ